MLSVPIKRQFAGVTRLFGVQSTFLYSEAFWEENLIFAESLETKAKARPEQRRGQIESNAIGFALSATRRTHSILRARPKQPLWPRGVKAHLEYYKREADKLLTCPFPRLTVSENFLASFFHHPRTGVVEKFSL